ncbi:hypothetical protein C5167_027656 [Papaver somniferum]|uniref:anthrax toxin receptor 1-like n=1 Tax=Papaver somniferum TaxID=3469 RepID=UPI000E70590E|nr:anthrax toxin receptor 1-like [Papaver somniferum]RZC91595.1 hypothetical protein C5167_027656 [Papaver somniferum]
MATTKTFPCASLVVLIFIFAIVGMLEMPSAAAISCGPGETLAESKSVSMPTIYCFGCQEQCITQCKSQGREVSKVECNFWSSDPAECKCCCRLPSSTPTPQPTSWVQCPSGESSMFFALNKVALDCNLCVNGCKTKCDSIRATVSRETCFQTFRQPTTLTDDGLNCPCCCKKDPPPPPPSPPPPSHPPPSPPPPSPSPPPPSPPSCPSPPSPGTSCGCCNANTNIQISVKSGCNVKVSTPSSSAAGYSSL